MYKLINIKCSCVALHYQTADRKSNLFNLLLQHFSTASPYTPSRALVFGI